MSENLFSLNPFEKKVRAFVFLFFKDHDSLSILLNNFQKKIGAYDFFTENFGSVWRLNPKIYSEIRLSFSALPEDVLNALPNYYQCKILTPNRSFKIKKIFKLGRKLDQIQKKTIKKHNFYFPFIFGFLNSYQAAACYKKPSEFRILNQNYHTQVELVFENKTFKPFTGTSSVFTHRKTMTFLNDLHRIHAKSF